MDIAKIEKIVEELALPIVEGLAYEFIGVEFVKESGEWYLRVYIDKEEGINHDDCADVSRALSDKLDVVDPISYSYYLEVSSPGLDRPLKKDRDFENFKGSKIKIKLFKALDGKKVYTGTLIGLEGDSVVLEADGNQVKIDRSMASSIRLNEI